MQCGFQPRQSHGRFLPVTNLVPLQQMFLISYQSSLSSCPTNPIKVKRCSKGYIRLQEVLLGLHLVISGGVVAAAGFFLLLLLSWLVLALVLGRAPSPSSCAGFCCQFQRRLSCSASCHQCYVGSTVVSTTGMKGIVYQQVPRGWCLLQMRALQRAE